MAAASADKAAMPPGLKNQNQFAASNSSRKRTSFSENIRRSET